MMGEAKSRGTFEERKQEAIRKNEAARIKRLMEKAEAERNKTPAQRQREREAQMTLAQLLALGATYGIIQPITHRKKGGRR